MKKSKSIVKYLNYFYILSSFIFLLLIVLNNQSISDQISVWTYSPTNKITLLADNAGFNDKGRFLFLASQPKLDGTSDFNSICGTVENVTSILGCYYGGRIYVYDVADIRLDGIREVTAAHEMLHAAYLRLSVVERKKVDLLLDAEYKKIKDDPNFSTRMAFYAKTEPDQIFNELHSVIGTEVDLISEELEEYYTKYFSDRKIVTSLNAKYLSTFQELRDRADIIKKKITDLANSITTDSDLYNNTVVVLNSDISDFNDKANGGHFDTQEQFYSERNRLLERASSLEAFRANINNNIAEYNQSRTDYNSIATESEKLYDSIDSTLAPAPSI